MANDTSHMEKVRARAEREICGDIDSIWIYGNDAQAKLADFSHTIAKTLATSNEEESERILNDAIEALERTITQETHGLFWRKANYKRKYQETLDSIDQMAVNLRIRQAQLLKDVSIFNQMSELIEKCRDELEIYINLGEKRLEEQSSRAEKDEQDEWNTRFNQKISELRTTHIIVLQSIAQVALLKQNDLLLIEKIGTALNNTIPLWRNQTAITFGLESYEDSNLIQQKIIATTMKMTKINNKEARKKIKIAKKLSEKEIDLNGIRALSEKLEDSLKDLKDIVTQVQASSDDMEGIILKLADINEPIKLTV